MTVAGIFDQDLLIVDRSKKKPNSKVVIASLKLHTIPSKHLQFLEGYNEFVNTDDLENEKLAA